MTSVEAMEAKEDLPAALRRALDPDALGPLLVAGAVEDVTPEIRERVLAKAEHLRAGLIGQVDDIPLEEELHWTLACSYVELKSQWIQRNVRLCYEQMITGAGDPEVAAEGSMISVMMHQIEGLLDPRHKQQIESLFITQVADAD